MSNGTNGTDRGVEGAARLDEHELCWDGLPPVVAARLAQPLDPALISRRRGRGNLPVDYLEGHAVIAQANAVFGFGGWGYEPVGAVVLREIERVEPDTGEVRRIRAYAAVVRVDVPGAPTRTDVGFHAVAEESAEGHETAYKGAVTDGLKRALRSFGDRFGNGLYRGPKPTDDQPRPDREPDQDAVGSDRARPDGCRDAPDEASPVALRERLVALGIEQGFDEERVRAAVREQTGSDLEDLPARELERLVGSAVRKVERMRQARAA